MNYGRRFVTCRGDRDQDHPQEKECKKAKWLSEDTLQIAVKRREAKSKGEKERYPFECRVPKNNTERKESLPQ